MDPQQANLPQIDLSAGMVQDAPTADVSPNAPPQNLDLSAGMVPDAPPASTEPDGFAQAGNLVSGLEKGFLKGAAGTVSGVDGLVSKIPGVGKWMTTPLVGDKTSEQAHTDLENSAATEGAPEKTGAGIESAMEFMGGDEALKGLSVAERLGRLSSIAKVLEAHPTLAKLVSMGATAARQGTTGAAQAAAHGEDAGGVAKEGATMTGLGAAGEGLQAGAEAAAPALKGWAQEMYARALAPAGKLDKADTQAVVPGLIQSKISGSLNKIRNTAGDMVDSALDKIKAAENDLPDDLPIDLDKTKQRVQDYLDSQKVAAKPTPDKVVTTPSTLVDEHGNPLTKETTVKGPTTIDVPTQKANAARNMGEQLQNLLDTTDPNIRNVIGLRRKLDDGLRGVYAGADPAMNGAVEAHKLVADTLRGQLADASPEMAHANSQYNFWRKVQDVSENTLARRTGQAGGLMHLGAGAAGAAELAAGNPMGAVKTVASIKAMQKVLQGPWMLTHGAVWADGLAQSLGEGNAAKATEILSKNMGAGAATAFQRNYDKEVQDQQKTSQPIYSKPE